MRRHILTLALILFSCIMSAQMTHNDSIVNSIKVKAIYEISSLYYPQDATFKKEDLKLKECLNPEDFIKKFSTDDKLKKCKECSEIIAKYDASSVTDAESLYIFFKTNLEKDFSSKKDSQSFKVLLKGIKKEASKWENSSTKDNFGETPPFAPQEQLEEDDRAKEAEMDSSVVGSNHATESNNDKSSNIYNPFEGLNVIPIVVASLFLFLLGVCVYLYIKTQKQSKQIKALLSQCDEISLILDVPNSERLPADVKAIVKECEKNRKRIADLESSIREKESNWAKQQELYKVTTGSHARLAMGGVATQDSCHQVQESVIGKEMYLGLPTNNVFNNPSDSYKSGKTLYKLTYTSEDTATYEFYNSPETIQYAKQSRSRFIECACLIDNEDVDSFSTISTIQKGELRKTDEGWKICKKACVLLA